MYDINWEHESNVDEYERLKTLFSSAPEKALLGFESLAERGSVASMLYLGEEYRTGSLKDFRRAKHWFGKADEMGNAVASFLLGVVCLSLDENNEAFAAFSRGAECGYLPAIYRLAKMHQHGTGVQKDLKKCRELLEVASSRGHLFAKRDLSNLFLWGVFGRKLILRGVFLRICMVFDAVAFLVRVAKVGVDAALIDERALA